MKETSLHDHNILPLSLARAALTDADWRFLRIVHLAGGYAVGRQAVALGLRPSRTATYERLRTLQQLGFLAPAPLFSPNPSPITRMSGERPEHDPRMDVPNLNRPVERAAGNLGAVGRPGNRPHGPAVAHEKAFHFAGIRIPDHDAEAACHRQTIVVRARGGFIDNAQSENTLRPPPLAGRAIRSDPTRGRLE